MGLTLLNQREKDISNYYKKCIDIINYKLDNLLDKALLEDGSVNKEMLLLGVNDIHEFIRNDI